MEDLTACFDAPTCEDVGTCLDAVASAAGIE